MLVLPHALVLSIGHPKDCVNFGGVVLDQLLNVLLHGQRVHLLERLIGPVAKVLWDYREREVSHLGSPSYPGDTYAGLGAGDISTFDLRICHLHRSLQVSVGASVRQLV